MASRIPPGSGVVRSLAARRPGSRFVVVHSRTPARIIEHDTVSLSPQVIDIPSKGFGTAIAPIGFYPQA